MGFPNPSISGSAIGKALDPTQAAADRLDATGEHAALDQTELQALERAEYYGDEPPAAPAPAVPAVDRPRRSLLDRLLHHGASRRE